MKTEMNKIQKSGMANVRFVCCLLAVTVAAVLMTGQATARPGAGAGGAASGGARGAGVGGAGAGPGHVGGAAGGAGVGFHGAGAGARGVGVAPGVGVGSPGVGVLPRGYYAATPAGYRLVNYGGYTCRYVNGVYYRAVMYQGQTVWVVV